MVGCTLFTLPPPCTNLEIPWWLPSFRPFQLGPFSLEPQDKGWGPAISWFTIPKTKSNAFDVEVYSIILLVCDVLLTAAWHYATKYIVTRKQFRLKFLSPSMRFTVGVLFGAFRLFVIAHLRPTALYFFLARFCFFIYLVLGLSALVFDDGPWRNVRPHARSALNRDSILNPYAAVNKALTVSVTKLTLARPAVRRTLESGKCVSIILDQNGSLLYARRGSIDIRDAYQMRKSDTRAIIELVCRHEMCKSGKKSFFGFVRGAPFEKFGVRGMTQAQKSSLLDLLVNLNDFKPNSDQSSWKPIDVRWFQVPNKVGQELKAVQEEDEQEEDRKSMLNFYRY